MGRRGWPSGSLGFADVNPNRTFYERLSGMRDIVNQI